MPHEAPKRWRHLALGNQPGTEKNLLLCGKSLAIEPCYEKITVDEKITNYYVSVKYGHAKVETGTWTGIYVIEGWGYKDTYVATNKIEKLTILASLRRDWEKAVLSSDRSFYSADVVRATISVSYSPRGKIHYPESAPKDRTYTEDFGEVIHNAFFGDLIFPGVMSGAVSIKMEVGEDGKVQIRQSEGSVGFIKKKDVVSGKIVNIISIAPPNVNVWPEAAEGYTEYEPVDDDDNY